ncbi:MFS-type transporter involved in bile tolerance, Atg22 family [Salinibacillus kushneri]|uniref:MFS-type transporter involved in bile tolerance, Atg22 family n=1 Tax=Salinibacillus kushneri TaxID=237682 RepID=A0A1I0G3B6_9BACI|nr:MFS-type transporter involved in bile tolerance, Atg22 family [Salinibacillus kushneri]
MYLPLLRNKNILYFLLGGGISRLGDALTGMAFLFLAYDLTGSTVHTTGMAIVETVPYLLFGLIGGVMADWLSRKPLLIVLDIIRIPLVLSIFVLDHLHLLTYSHLLIVSFFIQTLGCFFNPTHRAVLPIITDTEERAAANSFNDTLGRGVTILSPIISLWLLSYGAIYFFVVDALTYAISVFCLFQFTEQIAPVKKSVKGVFLAIRDFFAWTRQQKAIQTLFVFTFIVVFFNTWVWEVGILLALNEMTTNSEELYSILQGVFGGTVIVTNLILPYFIKKMNLKIYVFGSLVWGLGVSYYGILYQMEHFFIGIILVGIGLPIASLTRVYLLQALVPEHKLGRAFSSNAFLLYLSNTLSLLMFGVLVLIFPVQWLMIGSGLSIFMFSLLCLAIFTIRQTKFTRRFSINPFK